MDIERRRDTIHLYGVDVMSTDDVYKYFEEYGPTFVEWINDSSCERSYVGRGAGQGCGALQPSPCFRWFVSAASLCHMHMQQHMQHHNQRTGAAGDCAFDVLACANPKPDLNPTLSRLCRRVSRQRGVWRRGVVQARHGGHWTAAATCRGHANSW